MLGILFILFMTIVVGASFGITKVGDHFQNKQSQELEICIMEQIELSEENRDSYYPKHRDELLRHFIMKCIQDKSFRNKESKLSQ